MRILTILCLLFLCGWSLSACDNPEEQTITGMTMGTTYRIKVVAGRSADLAHLKTAVDQRLEAINRSMSTYRPDSEISRFNAQSDIDAPFAVSADFLRVMLAAREVYRLTGGALDGTIQPLVNLWGFGQDDPPQQVPSETAVEAARQRVGFDRIDISASGYLTKLRPDVTVDLSSIAKGYGVDQVAALLAAKGFSHFLVEIGGEIYAAGQRPDGRPWRVGINLPQPQAAADAVYSVVRLEDRALATSGDYRQYYEIDGRFFSHIIDPRSGYPVQNRVVSATVVADTCTLADALATAVVVLGVEQGLKLLNRLAGVEGLIVQKGPDGELINHRSQGFGALID